MNDGVTSAGRCLIRYDLSNWTAGRGCVCARLRTELNCGFTSDKMVSKLSPRVERPSLARPLLA
jgi:hypothetical protein